MFPVLPATRTFWWFCLTLNALTWKVFCLSPGMARELRSMNVLADGLAQFTHWHTPYMLHTQGQGDRSYHLLDCLPNLIGHKGRAETSGPMRDHCPATVVLARPIPLSPNCACSDTLAGKALDIVCYVGIRRWVIWDNVILGDLQVSNISTSRISPNVIF